MTQTKIQSGNHRPGGGGTYKSQHLEEIIFVIAYIIIAGSRW